MIAFNIGGTPITTLIGTDVKNLSWMATHPVGAYIFTLIPPVNSHNNRISTAAEFRRRKRRFRRDYATNNAGRRYAFCIHGLLYYLIQKLLKPDQHKIVSSTQRPRGEESPTSRSRRMLQRCCKLASRGDLP
jgi:hypothetical protein